MYKFILIKYVTLPLCKVILFYFLFNLIYYAVALNHLYHNTLCLVRYDLIRIYICIP